MKKLTELLEKYFNIKIENQISKVEMSSQKATKDSLFFAINNGNKFIKEALEKGAELIIADNPPLELKDDKRVIKVENTVKELQEIAKLYREELNLIVVGITGSEGKTTTKDLVYNTLSTKYKGIKTEGNYNNHIGLPYTILQLKDDDEIAILEMGMSNLGEIEKLSEISKPNYGIITNIGDSHLEYLINRENVFKAKTEMLKYVLEENMFVVGDDLYLKNLNSIKIGFNENNDYKIKKINETEKGIEFLVNKESYEISLNGDYNLLNATLAIGVAKKLKVDYEDILKGLGQGKITGMRFEKIERGTKLYINDAYNASPESMKASLVAFDIYPTSRKKIAVLGDMLELGENEIEYHKEIIEFALEKNIEQIFLFGLRMKEALNKTEKVYSEKVKYFETKDEIKNELKINENTAILLKASRSIKLEEIVKENKE